MGDVADHQSAHWLRARKKRYVIVGDGRTENGHALRGVLLVWVTRKGRLTLVARVVPFKGRQHA